jgi:hypothetical protein
MQPKQPSVPPTGNSPQPRIDADLVGQFAGDAWDANAIDDEGGYGTIDQDERPDFLKDDERGWIRLWPFGRR